MGKMRELRMKINSRELFTRKRIAFAQTESRPYVVYSGQIFPQKC